MPTSVWTTPIGGILAVQLIVAGLVWAVVDNWRRARKTAAAMALVLASAMEIVAAVVAYKSWL